MLIGTLINHVQRSRDPSKYSYSPPTQVVCNKDQIFEANELLFVLGETFCADQEHASMDYTSKKRKDSQVKERARLGWKYESFKHLFSNVLPAALYGQTITPFRALLNNYERSAGVPERNTITKQREISEFLEAIFSTDVIQTTYNLLHNKGHFASQAEFKDFLNATWFGLYSRSGGVLDSSAFEHTFVGEMKNGAVTGFHNWIQFCLQERAGNLNYYGYTREKQPNQLLLQFNWLGQVKTRSSIMHGVSPEFELALFTTCYIAQPNNLCRFTINDRNAAIRTWKHEGDKLGAAYFYV
nr:uridylate-specific endoribonuclease-like [Lytechinus pictus]